MGVVSAFLRWVFVGASQWGGVDEETEQVAGTVATGTAKRLRGGRKHSHTGRHNGPIVRLDTQHAARIRHHHAQSRGAQPPYATRQLGLSDRYFDEVEYSAELFRVVAGGQPCDQSVEYQIQIHMQYVAGHVVA